MEFTIQTQDLRRALACIPKTDRAANESDAAIIQHNHHVFFAYTNRGVNLCWQLSHDQLGTPDFQLDLPNQAIFELVQNTSAEHLTFHHNPNDSHVRIDIGSISLVKNLHRRTWENLPIFSNIKWQDGIEVNSKDTSQVFELISLLNNPSFPVVYLTNQNKKLHFASVEGARCIRATIATKNNVPQNEISIPLSQTSFLQKLMAYHDPRENWFITRDQGLVFFTNQHDSVRVSINSPTMKLTNQTINELYNSLEMTNELIIHPKHIYEMMEALSIINIMHDHSERNVEFYQQVNPACLVLTCTNSNGSVKAPIPIAESIGLENMHLTFDHKVLATLLRPLKNFPTISFKVGRKRSAKNWHLLRIHAINEHCELDTIIQAIQR